MDERIVEKAKNIKVLLLDVDGVLTDGRIVYDSRGHDMKFFDVHDGLGVYMLKKGGIDVVLITAKGSRCIKPRARDMHVSEVIADIFPKSAALPRILKRFKVTEKELCFVADDLVDLSLMKRVGFPVAVFNASPEIKQAASYITLRLGGRGAVREIAELILKAQGKWDNILKIYDV